MNEIIDCVSLLTHDKCTLGVTRLYSGYDFTLIMGVLLIIYIITYGYLTYEINKLRRELNEYKENERA
jgi:hypothetical protein